MNKKELKSLANQYNYLEKNEFYQERFQGLKMTLQILNKLKIVKNEVFKIRNKGYIQNIEFIESYINKAYGKKAFDTDLLNDYYNKIKYMEKLTEEDKRVLKANIEYIENRIT